MQHHGMAETRMRTSPNRWSSTRMKTILPKKPPRTKNPRLSSSGYDILKVPSSLLITRRQPSRSNLLLHLLSQRSQSNLDHCQLDRRRRPHQLRPYRWSLQYCPHLPQPKQHQHKLQALLFRLIPTLLHRAYQCNSSGRRSSLLRKSHFHPSTHYHNPQYLLNHTSLRPPRRTLHRRAHLRGLSIRIRMRMPQQKMLTPSPNTQPPTLILNLNIRPPILTQELPFRLPRCRSLCRSPPLHQAGSSHHHLPAIRSSESSVPMHVVCHHITNVVNHLLSPWR